MKDFKHRIEFYFVTFFIILFEALPLNLAYGFSKYLGLFLYYFVPIRRTTAYFNLKRVFPNKTDAEIYKIIRKMYVNFAYFFLESIIMNKLRENLDTNVEIFGLENLDAAVAKDSGVVLYTAHIGNWHIMGQRLVDAGYKINNLVKRQRNKYVFDKEMEAMTQSGMKITILHKTPKNIFKALKDKDIVEFLADQDAGDDGVFVDFFGVKAATATGPALFSLKMAAPIVFVTDVRTDLMKHKIYIESINYESTGNLETDVYALTQILTKKLEKYIIAHPEQYFWLHKRWLTRPKTKTKSKQ